MSAVSIQESPAGKDCVRPVRVLYVIDTLEVGGAEKSLVQFCQHRDRSDVEVTVCVLYRGDALKRELEQADVRVEMLNIKGKYQFRHAILQVREMIRHIQPDVVHTTLFRANQVGRVAGWLHNVPVISSFVSRPYDRERLKDDANVNPNKLRMLQILDGLTAKLVTRFHSVSDAVGYANCRDLRIRPSLVSVVHRGRNTSISNHASKTELRQTLGLDPQTPVILAVGRLVAEKGLKYLLAALEKVLQQLPNAILLIAGDGKLCHELEELTRHLGIVGNVRFLGHRTDTADLLQAADCFVFTSVSEGMPGSVVEAMAARTPIVASRIPVIEEIVTHEQHALLAQSRDDQSFATAILRLLGDEEYAAQLASNAQQHARANFDIVAITRKMEALYRDVAKVVAR